MKQISNIIEHITLVICILDERFSFVSLKKKKHFIVFSLKIKFFMIIVDDFDLTLRFSNNLFYCIKITNVSIQI